MALHGPYSDDEGDYYLDEAGHVVRPRELRRLHVAEVSLVDKPATGKRFLLYKSEGGESDMVEPLDDSGALLVETGLNDPATLEGEDDAVGSILDDEGRILARGGFRLLAKAAREGRLSGHFRQKVLELLKLVDEDEDKEPGYGYYEKPKRKPVRKAADLVGVKPEDLSPEEYEAHRQEAIRGYSPGRVEKQAAPESSALREFSSLVEGLVRKSDGKVSLGEASLTIMEQYPDVYARYASELRQLRP